MAAVEEPREIDWATAVVDAGGLTVELTGEPSKKWSEHMAGVVSRLDSGRWGDIAVARGQIKVAAVDADSVGGLRHLLESAAHQTNADLASRQEDEPSPDPSPPSTEEDDADRELTETFRGFGPVE